MVSVGVKGFYPLVIYARRTRKPLLTHLNGSVFSWELLGTNLSVKKENGTWDTETERLLLMDSRDFNKLGIGLDDLIEGYFQTVLVITTIEEMAKKLVTKKGRFRRRLFRSVNRDQELFDDIIL